MHSRSGGVDVENLTLVEAKFDETLAHIDGTVPDLDKVEPPVLGELEGLPGLLLRDLLAGHGLLDILFLLDGVYNVAPAEGVASTVLTGVVEEGVGDGIDPGLGALDEGVGVEGVTADGAVAVRGLGDLDRAIGGELCFVHGGISSRAVRSTDTVTSMVVGEMEDKAEIECRGMWGGVLSCDAGRLWSSLWSLWPLCSLEKCSPGFWFATRTGVAHETTRLPQCEPQGFMVALCHNARFKWRSVLQVFWSERHPIPISTS